ncbi:uncharacterized protein LOC131023279 [Salvia miltiorrhiza]|uniref:uncharacterized protein LOC131023279 n=1 Tax=Salvia miltiorrhiza TaxID=226208 RepID=UPI0025ACBA9D|nr:uncharacterized protein LOC131023279 [Salvia miltiorrhiza]
MTNDLAVTISTAVPIAGKEDSWVWSATKDVSFSTKSAYNIIQDSRNTATQTSFSKEMMQKMWDTPVPQKAIVTSWRLLRNRLPNIPIGEVELMCNACCHQLESANHLFTRCPKTEEVWIGVQRWLGVHTLRPQGTIEHFDAFTNLGRKKSSKFLRALWICTTWLLWKSRNERRFDGKNWEVQSLIGEIKVRLWSWNMIFKLNEKEMCFSSWMSGSISSVIV